ncbi:MULTISPECIES: beta-ketoacyl-ACP synthase 3 [unclassified Streptomyces]|uniref:beta-ketoacyl-ACP synthase 3 n=1 Tax=unclassified Streptomyces TaxID=2593676 RepID=UPI002E2D9A91|nr:beta-ketoacyl-ACP synthase 3 [Streptomyces sp. NBC_00223]
MHSTETERTFQPAADRHHPVLLGIGAYRPRRIVTNEEICRTLESSPEWILRRSGISTRCFARPDETLVEMGATAAGKALADAGTAPTDVDQILVATMSDLDSSDRLAQEIARRLGVSVPGWQVSAACAGFTVGLALAASAVSSGAARNVLVVGVERMSDILDPTDRGTAFLFSDGAGAALVGRAAEPGIGPVVWGTEPSLRETITVRPEPENDGRPYLRMQGSAVFRWAVTNLPDIVRTTLERSGVTPGDIQAFVPHQANLRIIESVAQAVGFPEEVEVARDIVDQGNASAASIPLALDRLRTSGALGSGDLALLIGFGAGLSYAATVVRMP